MNENVFLTIMGNATTISLLFGIAVLLLYIASKKQIGVSRSR